jgi:hypothetical protein
MKQRFTKIYLISAGIILALTALAKIPAVFPTSCLEDPILGSYQPVGISNETLVGFAAGVEFSIVVLICFSPIKWLPCLASALWGTLCLLVRIVFMDSSADCHCLGFFITSGPVTNPFIDFLAVVLAAGGWASLWITLRNSKQLKPTVIPRKKVLWMLYGVSLLIIAGPSLFWGLRASCNLSNYDKYEPFGPLRLLIAFPLITIGMVAIFQGIRIFRSAMLAIDPALRNISSD